MSNSKKLLLGIISICVIGSAICFYLASTHYSEPYLTVTPTGQPAGRPHELIAFDEQGNLMGVSLKQGRFLLDRYHLESAAEHTEVAAAGDPVQWILGADGMTLAWLSGVNKVSVQRAAFAGQTTDRTPWPAPKTFGVASELVTFGVLPDGTMGFVLKNGDIIRKDPSGAAPDSKLSLGARVSWAQLRGDYAAVVVGDKIFMYRFVKGDWKMIEERSDFPPGSERRLPADGQILAIVSGAVRVGEQTLNPPGKVSEVVMSDQGFVLVSGEFPGIYALPTGTMEAYKVLDTPAGTQLAASRSVLAYSGAAGTVMVRLVENSRLTETGRWIVGIATAFIILAILASLLLVFIDAKGLTPSIRRQEARLKDAKLPKPPPDLVKALSSGEATLWAGAGLSATSGFPLRHAFISSVFQTALIENWQTARQMDQYWKLVTDGKAEEALDKFIASNAANRIRVGDVARSTYSRFSSVNPTQRQLAKLPFKTAITTNYDTLLERSGSEWAINTTRVDGDAKILALGSHLTLKLFGDFEGGGVILARTELRAAMAANAEFAGAFADLFEARPILFVGASLEGLLEDLALLNAPRPSGIKHYCVAGIATLNWKPKANDLKSRYNVEVFPCDVLNIQEQLKVFLAELTEAVEAETAAGQAHPRMGQPVG